MILPPDESHLDTDGQPNWRRTLYATWASQLIAITGFGFVAPFLPFYIRELGITDENMVPVWAGIMLTAPGLMFVIFGPLWGVLADRYGRKLMVIRAMFSGAILLALMGRCVNIYQLLGLRLLQGVLTGTFAAAAALVSSVTPTPRLGYSMGLMQMSMFVGFSIGPWLGGITADHFGYRMPFYIAGGLLFLGGWLVIFGIRERFSPPSAERRKANGTLLSVMKNGGFPTLLAILFLINLGGTIVLPIFPLFVESLVVVKAKAASTTGLILGVSGIAAALSAVVVGRISDRHGHKKMLVLSTLFSGIFCIPQAIAQNVAQLLGLRVLFSLAVGGTGPSANAIIGKMAPRDAYGKAYGIAFAASCLGAAIGPLLGGLITRWLSLRAPFVIMGVSLMIISFVVALGLKKTEALAQQYDDHAPPQ